MIPRISSPPSSICTSPTASALRYGRSSWPSWPRAIRRAKLVAFVAEGNPTGAALALRVREAVHAILTMAEYQLA
jgi:hypothetical protein